MTPPTTPKEIIHVGALEIRFLLDGDDTAGQLCLFEFVVPPGARVPAPHYHESVDEAAYALSGVLTWTVDGRHTDLPPGEHLFVPRGTVHGFVNTGGEPAHTLVFLTPATIGPAYFREIAALLSGGPPDMAKVVEVMRRHGLVPASSSGAAQG